MAVIRVLIVDDHPVVRAGVRVMLSTQHDMKVVGDAASGEEAVAVFTRLRPDVIVMDLRLPGMTGVQAAAVIQRENAHARVLILTAYGNDVEVQAVLKSRVHGYLRKSADRSELLEGIRAIYDGGRYFPSDLIAPATSTSTRELTRREVEVLQRISGGLTNKKIGEDLSISEDTVKLHAKNLFGKLGVRDRAQAVAVAMKRGLLRLD